MGEMTMDMDDLFNIMRKAVGKDKDKDPEASQWVSKAIDGRTLESVEDTLLFYLSDNILISGRHDVVDGISILSKEMADNPEFAAAVRTVSATVMRLFPNG